MNSWSTLVLCAETVAQCYWWCYCSVYRCSLNIQTGQNMNNVAPVDAQCVCVGRHLHTWHVLAVQIRYLYLYMWLGYLYFRVCVLDTPLQINSHLFNAKVILAYWWNIKSNVINMYLTKQRQLCGRAPADRRQKPNLNWLLMSVRTNVKYWTGWLETTTYYTTSQATNTIICTNADRG